MYPNNPEIKKLDRSCIRDQSQGDVLGNEFYNKCNISSLENRRTVHSRNVMFKNKKLCKDINNDNDYNIVTRSNDGPTSNILKPNCETYKEKMYFYRAVIDWNNLDPAIRNEENICLFE